MKDFLNTLCKVVEIAFIVLTSIFIIAGMFVTGLIAYINLVTK